MCKTIFLIIINGIFLIRQILARKFEHAVSLISCPLLPGKETNEKEEGEEEDIEEIYVGKVDREATKMRRKG